MALHPCLSYAFIVHIQIILVVMCDVNSLFALLSSRLNLLVAALAAAAAAAVLAVAAAPAVLLLLPLRGCCLGFAAAAVAAAGAVCCLLCAPNWFRCELFRFLFLFSSALHVLVLKTHVPRATFAGTGCTIASCCVFQCVLMAELHNVALLRFIHFSN